MSWHQDGKIHISWGPEGEKLSAAEKETHAAELVAEAEMRQDEYDAAKKSLEGMPYVPVPIDQLADIYERMLRLVNLGQSRLDELDTLPEPVRELRRAVFNQADFGAVYAGQWLPPELRTRTRDKVKAELSAKPTL